MGNEHYESLKERSLRLLGMAPNREETGTRIRFGVGPCSETGAHRKKGGSKPKPLLSVQDPKTQKWVRDINDILQDMLKEYPGFHWSTFEIAETADSVRTLEDASGEVLTIVLDRPEHVS